AFNFSMPPSEIPLELKASVRWTGRLARDRSQGAGVEFLEMDFRNTVQIKRYVESVLEEQDEYLVPST
ncbi:MAG: hypothetical protein EP302_04085, partial [Bacteroidetes bacterium]